MVRQRPYTTSRRTFLQSTGIAGLAAGFGGVAIARDDGEEPEETFSLVGNKDAWIGRAPSSIDGERNPTLELEAGETYRIEWENGDGSSHNVAIYSEDGILLVHSPFTHEEGATQTVDFVATEGMIDYYCEVHWQSMRGSVEVSGTSDREEEPVEAGYFDDGPTVGLETIAEGFSYPVAMATANEDRDRFFVADQPGQVYAVDDDGVRDEPFLDVEEKLYHETPVHPEVGLLGIEFHPEFADNRRFFTRESRPKLEGTPEDYHHTEVLVEYEATDDLTSADPESEQFVLEMPSPQSNHNSGNVEFGPDGYLYVVVPDGGFGGDTQDMLGHAKYGNGQDVTENLLGSILRIDVDNEETVRGEEKQYAIPDDNPLVGEEGLDEQWAWGFRSPWGTSFDSDGRLFTADVMRTLYEEVNLVEKGGNYGWNIKEGAHCFNPDNQARPPDDCPDENHRGEPLIDPIIEYPHVHEGKPVGQSVIGGATYEGDEIDALQGRYVFGDWSYSPIAPHGVLLVAEEPENDDELWPVEKLQVPERRIPDGRLPLVVIAFGRDDDGEVYLLASDSFERDANAGAVHKIVPSEASEGDQTEGSDESSEDDQADEEGADEDMQQELPADGTDTVAAEEEPGFGAPATAGGVGALATLLRRRCGTDSGE